MSDQHNAALNECTTATPLASLDPDDFVQDDATVEEEAPPPYAPSPAQPFSGLPTLGEIASFAPTGAHDDFVSGQLPVVVRRAVEALVLEICTRGIGKTVVYVWALDRGLRRLVDLPDVRTIGAARMVLLPHNHAGLSELDTWAYSLAAGALKKVTIRRVSGDLQKRLAVLKTTLGLSAYVVLTLALIGGLADAPLPPGVPATFKAELRTFFAALKTRARFADELTRDLRVAAPPQPEQVPWQDYI